MNYLDPELPAGLQDADIEMSELSAAANRRAHFRRKGICDHGWTGPNRDGAAGGFICHDCGAWFKTQAALDDSRDQAREAML